uniref:Core NTPase n=1 Tax=Avian orthoreovirus TaxID=38170 RepID=A0A385JBA8_9REOV|nr:core NTPase [Avian orthoreovirus]
MAYLATPVLAVGDPNACLTKSILGLTNRNIESLPSVSYISPTLTLRQIDLVSSGVPISEVASAIIHRDWRRPCSIRLLPSKRSLLEYLHANPSILPQGLTLPMVRGFLKQPGNFRMSDFFRPLITEATPLLTAVRWMNSSPTVFSLTHKVVGGKLYLYAPQRYYSFTPDLYRELSIGKSSDRVVVLPPSRVYVGAFPSAASGNAALVDRVRWMADDVHPMVKALQCAYDARYRMTARYLSDPLTAALLQGETSVRKLKVPAIEARAARSIGIRVHSLTPPRGINTQVIHVTNLAIMCRHSMVPTERPYKLVFHALPHVLLAHLGLTLSEDWVPIRDETGMFQMWFMVLTLTCDKISDASGRLVSLTPDSISPTAINFVQLLSTTAPRSQSLTMMVRGRLDSVGLCMAKGSFKSTMVKFLTGLSVCGTRIIYPDTIMDSDDVGDALSPTFEQMLLDDLLASPGSFDLAKLESSTDLVNQSYVATHMYPTFLRLLRDKLTPKAMSMYTERSSSFRSLTYAHADSEFLDACWTARLDRAYINYREEENILLRPNRVGGPLFQVALSRCYKMYATSAPLEPISLFLKSLFVPCLKPPPFWAITRERSPLACWRGTLTPNVADAGWCTCDPSRHVTYTFVRGLPDDLAYLDLLEWSRFRATIEVLPQLLDLGNEFRIVAAKVHWVSQRPAIEMFDGRALFTPFQHYHVSMHCNCPLGRSFSVKGIHLRMSTVGSDD